MADQGGRPTKYKAKYAKQAKKLCELGATDKELIDFFSVSESTLNRWKIEHKEFSESIKLGKDGPNTRVERSLYERAIGYSHEDTDIRVVNGKIVKTKITKHYPPDSTAMIFFLKNRMKEEYREKPEADPESFDGPPTNINIHVTKPD